MWPKPGDITVGICKAEGHYILHLAYAITIFMVKKASYEPMECVSGDSTFTHELPINDQIQVIQYMHFTSAFLIIVSIYLDATDLDAHIFVVLGLFSALLYVCLILTGQETLQLIYQAQQKDKEGCDFSQWESGHVKQWVVLEIVAFCTNLAVSAFHISISYFSTNAYRKTAI